MRKARYPTIDAATTLNFRSVVDEAREFDFRTDHRVVLVFGLAWHEREFDMRCFDRRRESDAL